MPSNQQCLTLSLSNHCPMQCAHCGPESGPSRRGGLDLATTIELLDVARERNIAFVNITGGEPFSLGPQLTATIAEASARRLMTRVTTGAYWSGSVEKAMARLEPLHEAGLSELCISCSEEHQRFVPLAHVIHAVEAARACGVNALLSVGVRAGTGQTSNAVKSAFDERAVPPPPMFESPLIPFGRAKTLPQAGLLLRPVEELDGPCPSMMEHPTVFSDGAVAGCAGVFVGECRTLHFGRVPQEGFRQALDRLAASPLSNWIHHLGVVQLKAVIEQHSAVRFADRYVNICHLCGDIFSNPEAVSTLQRLGLESGFTSDV